MEEGDEPSSSFLQDLPLDTRGPLRIEPVDSYGSAIMCAGWRVDGANLADKCRQLASIELERYGKQNVGVEYGRYLAKSLNSYMASCAFSESVRSLSSIALLANGSGQLHFIDATGAYPCRAYAMGIGSKRINERLQETNFSSLSSEECVQTLLDIIEDCQSPTPISKSDDDEDSLGSNKFYLPPSSRAEIVFLNSCERKMQRLRGLIQK